MTELLFKDIRDALDANSIVSVADPSGRIVYVNDRFCDISKYSQEELIGADHRVLNSGFHPKSFWTEMWKTISSGKPWSAQVCNKAKDGTIYWVQSDIIPIFAPDKKIKNYVSIRKVITREKELEKQLKEKEIQIIHASRMALLGDMAGSIAHEINNPLTVIAGKVRKIRSLIKNTPCEQIEESLVKIDTMTEKITKIIVAVRKSARDGSNDPFELIQLSTILSDLTDVCHDKLERKGVSLKVLPAPDVKIEVQAAQITQVLTNLVNNSCDAVQGLSDKWVEISWAVADTKLRIFVTDSGPGIPQEVLKQMNKPYFTTKTRGQGTGLGLSICKSILSDHNGLLSIDQTCKNTRFVVEIPLQRKGSGV